MNSSCPHDLALPMPLRTMAAGTRVDVVRDCVALARDRLVYCLEQADRPDGVVLEEVRTLRGAVFRPGSGDARGVASSGEADSPHPGRERVLNTRRASSWRWLARPNVCHRDAGWRAHRRTERWRVPGLGATQRSEDEQEQHQQHRDD